MKSTNLTLLLLFVSLICFSQKVKFGKVNKELVQEIFYPQDSSASAAYLYIKRRTYFNYLNNSGFQVITQYHKRIKIYTKEGLNFANEIISYYTPEYGDKEKVSNIKGVVFNLEKGKLKKTKLTSKSIFKDKKSKYYTETKISMPNVKVGSVIDIKYNHYTTYPTRIRDIECQFNIPIKHYIGRVEIPEWLHFKTVSKGFIGIKYKEETRATKIAGIDTKYNIKEYIVNDVPALRDDEPYVDNIDNYRSAISFELSFTKFPNKAIEYVTTTWNDVSKKIHEYQGFGNEIKKSSFYKKDLEALLAKAKDHNHKVALIFNFVKSKVKWNKYYGKYTDKGVRKAYKEGVGNVADINLLLTSMLREANLEANPVLVSTKSNGIPLFPTLSGFNYVISMVTLPTGYILLDATEPYSLPNVLPTRTLNWNGRKVSKDGTSSWVKLASSKQAIEENRINVKITDDLTLEGYNQTKYKNLNAVNYRIGNNHIKDDDLISKLENKNNIEIEDFKITGKKQIYKPISLRYKFSSEDLIEGIGNKLYLYPLLFNTKTTNPFKSLDRKFPIDFHAPWKDKNLITIQIPKDYKIESIPEQLAIALPDNIGHFKFITQNAGNKISVITELNFNIGKVSPTYYQQLKEFYSKIISKQKEKIVLTKI